MAELTIELLCMTSWFIFSKGFIKEKMMNMYIGMEIRERRKRLGFCASKTPPTRIRMETSRKRERMVEAKASMIELASVNREMISPVRRVAKKDIGSSKIWRI